MLKHVKEVLRLRMLVIAFIHLPITYSGIYRERFVCLLGNQINDCTGRTWSVEGTARTFHYLDAIYGMQVKTFVIQITRHVACHALSVHQKQHVACVQPLHGDFITEPHLLYVKSRRFLLQCLLKITISGIYQCFAAKYLCRNRRHLDGTGCTWTCHDNFIYSQVIFFHINDFFILCPSNLPRHRYIADISHLIIADSLRRKL